jgi:hypothetical protein
LIKPSAFNNQLSAKKENGEEGQIFCKNAGFFQPAGCQVCRLTGLLDIDFILNIFTDKQLKKSLQYSIRDG